MDRPQEKRIIYICLLGMAAILPIVINHWEGPYISIAAIFFVVLYIRSDQKRMKEQRGFPVITEDDPTNVDKTQSDKDSNVRTSDNRPNLTTIATLPEDRPPHE